MTTRREKKGPREKDADVQIEIDIAREREGRERGEDKGGERDRE